jgi:heme exporter protein CcmD
MADHSFYIAWSYGALAAAIALELLWLRRSRQQVLKRLRDDIDDEAQA